MSVPRPILAALLLLVALSPAWGQDDLARYRAAVRTSAGLVPAQLSPLGDGYRLEVEGGGRYDLTPASEGYVAVGSQGAAGRLANADRGWRLTLGTPRPSDGGWVLTGNLARSALPQEAVPFELILSARRRASERRARSRTRRRARRRPADAKPPTLEVTAPARGALTDHPSVRVRGRVTDASGVASLWVNGVVAERDAEGFFDAGVSLTPGLNLIRLEAQDAHGNRTCSVRSIARGSLLDAASPTRSAAAVRLEASALRWAELGANTRLAAFDLEAALMAQNPLVDRRLGGRYSRLDLRAAVSSASFGTPSVSLEPARGVLHVDVAVPAIRIGLGVKADLRYGPTLRVRATVSARRARIQADAVPSVSNGVVTTTLRNVRVSFDRFHVNVRRVPHFVDKRISRAARSIVADLLGAQVESLVPPQIDRVLRVTDRPLTPSVAGRTVRVRLIPERIAFDPRGVTIELGAASPGSSGRYLGTPGAMPRLGDGTTLAIALDDDLLNRASHEAWRLGFLNQRVSAASAIALGAPEWIRDVRGSALAELLPEALDGTDPQAPLSIELRPSAAPILRPLPGGAVEVGVGDLQVVLQVGPHTVLRAFVSARVRATISLGDDGALTLAREGEPEIDTDVIDGGASRRGLAVAALLEDLLPSALDGLIKRCSGLVLPIPAEVRPTAVEVDAANGHLRIAAHVPTPVEAALNRLRGAEPGGLPSLFDRRTP